MAYKCDQCGALDVPGRITEVGHTPKELRQLDPAVLAGYLEADHFLETGCRGSLLPFDPTPRLIEVGGLHAAMMGRLFEECGYRSLLRVLLG